MISERIGIFGGTFDPPHIAHLVLAERVLDVLQLNRVVWVPAGAPPHKENEEITPITHRLEMVNRAIVDNPAFELSYIDVNRNGPSYTVDMLALFAERHPQADLFFIIGGDSLRDISKWYKPERLIDFVTLAVVERPGVTYDFAHLEHVVPGLSKSLVRVDVPRIDISATEIREYVGSDHSIRYLVTSAVAQYIKEHQLYR